MARKKDTRELSNKAFANRMRKLRGESKMLPEHDGPAGMIAVRCWNPTAGAEYTDYRRPEDPPLRYERLSTTPQCKTRGPDGVGGVVQCVFADGHPGKHLFAIRSGVAFYGV